MLEVPAALVNSHSVGVQVSTGKVVSRDDAGSYAGYDGEKDDKLDGDERASGTVEVV